MRIYTKIILDIETGIIIYKESYDYDGNIALCKGSTRIDVPPPPQKSATEIETETLYLQMLKDMQNKTGAYAPSELDKLIEEYGVAAMKDYIDQMPADKEFREKSMKLLLENLEFQTQQLQSLADMRKLGEITGDLTQDEKDMFQKMADQATQKITDSVNKEQADVMDAAIASLVDRGILQGGVGVEILSKIGERAQELIAQGASDVETQKLANMLSTIESNKNRAVQWSSLGQNQQQIVSGLASSNYTAASQPIATAQGIQQYAAGLKQQYGANALGGYNAWLGTQSGERMGQANAALQAAIASAENKAGLYGAKMSGIASIFGGASGTASSVIGAF